MTISSLLSAGTLKYRFLYTFKLYYFLLSCHLSPFFLNGRPGRLSWLDSFTSVLPLLWGWTPSPLPTLGWRGRESDFGGGWTSPRLWGEPPLPCRLLVVGGGGGGVVLPLSPPLFLKKKEFQNTYPSLCIADDR